MKKIASLLTVLLFCLNLAYSAPVANSISMTTSNAIGSNISIYLKAASNSTPVQVDFGNGILIAKTVNR
jgi:hypothetical protein